LEPRFGAGFDQRLGMSLLHDGGERPEGQERRHSAWKNTDCHGGPLICRVDEKKPTVRVVKERPAHQLNPCAMRSSWGAQVIQLLAPTAPLSDVERSPIPESAMSDGIARLNAALEGRYAIERELGEGGMASVYLAKDLKHERKVALKVLKPELEAAVADEDTRVGLERIRDFVEQPTTPQDRLARLARVGGGAANPQEAEGTDKDESAGPGGGPQRTRSHAQPPLCG
jgi:hypothetical protein